MIFIIKQNNGEKRGVEKIRKEETSLDIEAPASLKRSL